MGRPRKPIKDKGPMKLVRVDDRTIIEVSVKISDKKAIKTFLARIEDSKPDYGKGGRVTAAKAIQKKRTKKQEDPNYPRRKR